MEIVHFDDNLGLDKKRPNWNSPLQEVYWRTRSVR